MKRDEIFRAFNRQSVETATMRKYVAEYEQMWKWMVDFFLGKFQGRGNNIDNVNSISIAKLLIFFNILRAVAR